MGCQWAKLYHLAAVTSIYYGQQLRIQSNSVQSNSPLFLFVFLVTFYSKMKEKKKSSSDEYEFYIFQTTKWP